MRKLLPYEHQLIESLGVTKEEYLEFVAIQQEYKDPKVGTALDARAEVTTTTAVVLTIVGAIFQVASALLFKPELPEARTGRRQRQQRFAPSFGFNSAQELGRYGDPVNLVYTRSGDDFNPNGGVRVGGALVWSSIENRGSTQFMRLQMVLGASEIKRIDPDKIAFGQLALSTLNPGLAWVFYKNGAGTHKSLRFSDKISGDLDLFPSELKGTNSSHVCKIRGKETLGFSQAYSPTASTSLGVFDAIPVNVTTFTRNDKGREKDAPVGITVEGGSWGSSNNFFGVGDIVKIRFQDSGYKPSEADEEALQIGVDIRSQGVEALDFGSSYMLGAATFRLINLSGRDIYEGDVVAEFECVEGGRRPSASYGTIEPTKRLNLKSSREDLQAAADILADDDEEDSVNVKVKFANGNINVNYSGNETVSWTDILNKKRTYSFPRGGSIEFTKSERATFLADERPTLKTADVKKEYTNQIKTLAEELDDVREGAFDSTGTLEEYIEFYIDADRGLQNYIKADAAIKDFFKIKSDHPYFTEPTLGMLTADIQAIRKQGAKAKVNQKESVPDPIKSSALIGDPSNISKKRRRFLNQDTTISIEQETEAQISELRDQRAARRELIKQLNRRIFIRIYKNFVGAFTSEFSGEVYISGIRDMRDQREDLPGTEKIDDKKGIKAIRQAFRTVIQGKRQDLRAINAVIDDWENYVSSLDNNFFVKCLVKSESATYETISPCDSVRFSIKGRLFRRISGRDKKYADEKAPKEYSYNDNGVKGRMTFFSVKYKTDVDANYRTFPVIFVLRHGTESDFYAQLNFKEDLNQRARYSFKFSPVFDVSAETKTNGQSQFGFIESGGTARSISDAGVTFSWEGTSGSTFYSWGVPKLPERGPKLVNEWDMFSVNTDTQTQFSHESGPELAITAVTEQQKDASYTDKYKDLSMLAIAVNAGRGIQDLRNVTAFVTQGKKSYRVGNLSEPANDSTCFAPDIFVDTVLDPVHGVGKYTDSSALDQDSLVLAKSFCKNNNLPVKSGNPIKLCMDGVIADASSWRSFWVENAPFSLLELARKNGADTLVPAIPVNSSGAAADANGLPVPLEVSALFTPGNILEGSYKEEFLDYGSSTKELIASVIYRDQSKSEVFSTNQSVQVKSKNVDENEALRQTFDASQFVTQKEQAILFGKLLVNQRRLIEKAIEFKTFPSEAAIEPGAFIYVDVGMKQWDSYSTGIVMEGGALNVPIQDRIANGTYSFLFYDPNTGDVDSSSHTVTNDVAAGISAANIGRMFVMGASKPNKRVYRVSEVAIEEGGEISVKAVEYPCFEDGGQTRASIADFRSSNFEVS